MKAEFIGLPDGSIYIVNQPETGADDPLTTLDQIVLMYDAKIKEITPQQPSEGEIITKFYEWEVEQDDYASCKKEVHQIVKKYLSLNQKL